MFATLLSSFSCAPIHSLGEQAPSHPRPFRGDGLRILNQLAAKRVKINSPQQRVQRSHANLKKLSPSGRDQMQMRLLLGQGMKAKAKATHHNRALRFPSMYIYSPQQCCNYRSRFYFSICEPEALFGAYQSRQHLLRSTTGILCIYWHP